MLETRTQYLIIEYLCNLLVKLKIEFGIRNIIIWSLTLADIFICVVMCIIIS